MPSYTESDLLTLAKRFHNTKRTYLLVDPLQGKHLSVKPAYAMELFHTLGKLISENVEGVNLVIGFAETATAVGMSVAEEMSKDCIYIHTTRELIPEVSSWIEFNEEHSHAVDQKLDASHLKEWINNTDSIVFVDDEISTGKTLINFVTQLRSVFPELDKKRMIAASIINRLSLDNRNRLLENGIECVSVLELDENDYEEMVKKYVIEGAKEPDSFEIECEKKIADIKLLDPRRGLLVRDYHRNCNEFSESIIKGIDFDKIDNDILVLGTEECMYPALVLGDLIEKKCGKKVYTHSTTRSPIGICDDKDYPIHNGYMLKSLYDENRVTYVYNLRKYDRVLIVTDSRDIGKISLFSLINALKMSGNDNILLIRG